MQKTSIQYPFLNLPFNLVSNNTDFIYNISYRIIQMYSLLSQHTISIKKSLQIN
jgi:hypothetical protein